MLPPHRSGRGRPTPWRRANFRCDAPPGAPVSGGSSVSAGNRAAATANYKPRRHWWPSSVPVLMSHVRRGPDRTLPRAPVGRGRPPCQVRRQPTSPRTCLRRGAPAPGPAPPPTRASPDGTWPPRKGRSAGLALHPCAGARTPSARRLVDGTRDDNTRADAMKERGLAPRDSRRDARGAHVNRRRRPLCRQRTTVGRSLVSICIGAGR